MTAALYARVSTSHQNTENQLIELRRYCEARGWAVWREYVDTGVSGAKDRRPALDALLLDAKRRRFQTVICWRLDRLGRSLRHLLMTLEELQAIRVGFVSMNEGIDLTTPAGRLQLHILAALADFERSRIQERVRAGLQRVKAQGKRLGRPPEPVPLARLQTVAGMAAKDAAARLNVSCSTLHRWRAVARAVSNKSLPNTD